MELEYILTPHAIHECTKHVANRVIGWNNEQKYCSNNKKKGILQEQLCKLLRNVFSVAQPKRFGSIYKIEPAERCE